MCISRGNRFTSNNGRGTPATLTDADLSRNDVSGVLDTGSRSSGLAPRKVMQRVIRVHSKEPGIPRSAAIGSTISLNLRARRS